MDQGKLKLLKTKTQTPMFASQWDPISHNICSLDSSHFYHVTPFLKKKALAWTTTGKHSMDGKLQVLLILMFLLAAVVQLH